MKSDLLIVGAGPTGLTAAVELARHGVIPRLIDRKPAASTLSRAVGINARTLGLLAESGVSKDLLASGVKIREARFHIEDEYTFGIDLGRAPKPYDFLLALPQDATEHILIEKFESLGGIVEFGTELRKLTPGDEKVSAEIKHLSEGQTINADYSYVFGADGIKSAVRESVGISFAGLELPDEWSIVDFDSASWPHKKTLCLFIYEKGRVCLVVPIGENRYRGVSDRPDAVKAMPQGLKIDKIRREGNFVIWVKQAETYQSGNIYIGGDAAHSHSPVGGRGMNLGIADAECFARLFTENRLNEYSSLRHPVGRETVRMTERARRFVTSDLPGKFLMLNRVAPLLARSETIQKFVSKIALDIPD